MLLFMSWTILVNYFWQQSLHIYLLCYMAFQCHRSKHILDGCLSCLRRHWILFLEIKFVFKICMRSVQSWKHLWKMRNIDKTLQSLVNLRNLHRGTRFFGTFIMTKWVGENAAKLDLHGQIMIHSAIHVSPYYSGFEPAWRKSLRGSD